MKKGAKALRRLPRGAGRGNASRMPGALLVALLAAAAPVFAHGSETWFGLVPCELCRWQRWPYWGAALAALAAALLWRRAGRPLLRVAGGLALVSAGIGLFHMGVEFGWWPSPLPGCAVASAGAAQTVEDLLAGLRAAPAKPCDEPAFLIPGLPLSMAALNAIYGVGLGAVALALPLGRRKDTTDA